MSDLAQATETVDRRLARGERRRAELIEATLTVIERDGVGGVSHRAVSRVAGVSASAALHHFATLDDLLVAALVSASEDSMAAIVEVEDIEGLTRLLTEEVVERRPRFVALFQLYLLAARRPALRPEAHRWIDAVQRAAKRLGADETGARALAIAMDGLGLHALIRDEVPDPEEATAILRRALS
jgi:DNA-binding transcriptional regulator YbjK